jgi:opacity protein-like surface antigen
MVAACLLRKDLRTLVPPFICAFLFGAGAVAPALAQDASRWSLGVRGVYSWYSHEYSYPYQGVSNNLKIEDGRGFGAFAGLRLSSRFGLELALSELSFDASLSSVPTYPIPGPPTYVDSGTFSLRSALASFYFNFPLSSRFEVYLGPTLGLTSFNEDVGVPREDELTYGAALGLSAQLGDSRWSVLLDYRYLKTTHETTDRDFYGDFASPAVGLGLKYRL